MNLRLQRLLKLHGLYQEKANDGTGVSTSSGSGGDGGGEGAGEGGGAEGGDGEGQGAGGGEGEGQGGAKKPSDAEAALLKDLMKQKNANNTLKTQLEQATARLKDFEGLDVTKVRELLTKAQADELAAAEARGDFERVKAQMVERHTAELNAATTKASELERAINELNGRIAELTIGSAFKSSPFLAELTLTPRKAQVIYGPHFDHVDGKTVGYDKPRGAADRTMLVGSDGEPLDFDAALKRLVDSDPDSDELYRAKGRAGASSSTLPAKQKQEERPMSSIERIAKGLKALSKA